MSRTNFLRVQAVGLLASLDSPNVGGCPQTLGTDFLLDFPVGIQPFSNRITFGANGQKATGSLATLETATPTVALTAASGFITVQGILTSGATLTIGATTYTVGTAGLGKIPVGSGTADQANKLLAVINGTDGVNTAHTAVTATLGALSQITVRARTGGTAGNALALTKGGTGGGANMTLSGATLSGGLNAFAGVSFQGADGNDAYGRELVFNDTTLVIFRSTVAVSLVLDTDVATIPIPAGVSLFAAQSGSTLADAFNGDLEYTATGAGVLDVIVFAAPLA